MPVRSEERNGCAGAPQAKRERIPTPTGGGIITLGRRGLGADRCRRGRGSGRTELLAAQAGSASSTGEERPSSGSEPIARSKARKRTTESEDTRGDTLDRRVSRDKRYTGRDLGADGYIARGRFRPTLAGTGGSAEAPAGLSPFRGPCGPLLSRPQPNTAAKQTPTPHSPQTQRRHPPAPHPPRALAGVAGVRAAAAAKQA